MAADPFDSTLVRSEFIAGYVRHLFEDKLQDKLNRWMSSRTFSATMLQSIPSTFISMSKASWFLSRRSE
jgi:hypothetical protein